MRYVLAVDGGGTKTELLARATDGSRTLRAAVGPTSVKSVGVRRVAHNLRKGLDAIAAQAGAGLDAFDCTVFGMSGLDGEQDERTLRGIIEGVGWQRERYLLVNDGVLALYAAAEPPGMVLIAGTGSIVVGVDREGQVTRTGGWGYGFSDLGSGEWLGSEALKYTVLHCDGCYPYVPWFDDVRRQLGADTFTDVAEIATAIAEHDRIAALAPILLNHAGEPLRDRIVAEGAGWLAAMLAANDRRMRHAEGERFAVALAGGCLRDARYAAAVVSNLPEHLRACVVPPDALRPPAEGGIALAKRFCAHQA